MHIIFSTAQVKECISLYWNDYELNVEEYGGNKKQYYCGKELLKFTCSKSLMYTILVIDYDDCCCADVYSDGEIITRFSAHSEVPHKHRKGGQSAARFQRIRDNEITLWFKRINEYLKKIDTDIHLGISPIYKRRFVNTLSTYNNRKIKIVKNTEYTNISGIYQYINKLENERRD